MPLRESSEHELERRSRSNTNTMWSIKSLVESISRYYSEQRPMPHKINVEEKIILGVCARDKKSKSKAMKEVLTRLAAYDDFQIIVFRDEVILKEPIEKWPVCHALISFYSTGFPLEKAIAYADLRKPFQVNDLRAQQWLLDRTKVYEVLKEAGIPTPRHVILRRDENGHTDQVIEEDEDFIEIDGMRFMKPFVEKPIDAENHNIRIYYPGSAGGGAQWLFRKIGDKSSEFVPDCNEVRKDGSYLYEDFMATEGTDVKVYSVGEFYAHAEARKSPVVDGKVQRTADGKEVRYPVMLSALEKEAARAVTMAFKQTVCGFDLLRTNGASYVCDVNGWSFVKGNMKYYEDVALILRETILRAVAPDRLITPIIDITELPEDEAPAEEEGSRAGSAPKIHKQEHLELRCLVGVFRHGDRTPKQKMKMLITHDRFLEFMNSRKDTTKEVKIKKPQDLQRMLEICRDLLGGDGCDSDIEERLDKLMQMKYVLERGGHFSGINRKIQIKATRWKAAKADSGMSSSESSRPQSFVESSPIEVADKELLERYDSLAAVSIGSAGSEASERPSRRPASPRSPKRVAAEEEKEAELQRRRHSVMKKKASKGQVVEAQLILKWGGELTKLGRAQSILLGEKYRCTMYPGESAGLLRLHSTFRHDLKIYCSDEGRVQVTAAAFAKGFLQLDGNLTPILVSLCRKDTDLLDDASKAEDDLRRIKDKVHEIMTLNEDLTLNPSLIERAVPCGSASLINSLHEIKNPYQACQRIYTLIQSLTAQLRAKRVEEKYRDMELYAGETLTLVMKRWEKLEKDFYSKKKERFDISKIPDIYDCIKFDCIHNWSQLFFELDGVPELYQLAHDVAAFVVPQEYGVTASEKAEVGRKIGGLLIKKILLDLAISCQNHPKSTQVLGQLETVHRLDPVMAKTIGVKSMGRHVRTRLYFTSESHIHSLLNSLRYGVEDQGLLSQEADDILSHIPELNYLSQIIFMLYENYGKPIDHPERYMVKLLFSPGAMQLDVDKDFTGPRLENFGEECEPLIALNDDLPLDDVENFLNKVLEQCLNDA